MGLSITTYSSESTDALHLDVSPRAHEELPALPDIKYPYAHHTLEQWMCVMSDGRFAVLGGSSNSGNTSSCEALMVDEDEHWHSLLPMRHMRSLFACAAVARCIIDCCGRAGDHIRRSVR
jgi:hypothetical protein